MEAGADVNLQDKEGEQIMGHQSASIGGVAEDWGCRRVVETGADVNLQDKEGECRGAGREGPVGLCDARTKGGGVVRAGNGRKVCGWHAAGWEWDIALP